MFEPGDTEIRVRDLKAVARHVAAAVGTADRRVELDSDAGVVRRIAGPLGVGKATEMHYLLGDDRFTPWGQEIERALGRRAQTAGTPADGPVTVGELRGWIDAVEPAHGLRPEVADLVIITWAALRQRAWFQHGTALAAVPDPGSLAASMELRAQELPSADEWAQARTTAHDLLRVSGASFLTASGVADFAGQVGARSRELSGGAADLVSAIESAYTRLGITGGPRLRTAQAAAAVVARLRHLEGIDQVRAVASPALDGATPAAAGRSLESAAAVTAALRGFHWDRLDPLLAAMRTEGARSDAAAAVVDGIRKALENDELVTSVVSALAAGESGIFSWLAATPPARPPIPDLDSDRSDDPEPPRGEPTGRRTVSAGVEDRALLADLRGFLELHPGATVEVSWRVVP